MGADVIEVSEDSGVDFPDSVAVDTTNFGTSDEVLGEDVELVRCTFEMSDKIRIDLVSGRLRFVYLRLAAGVQVGRLIVRF